MGKCQTEVISRVTGFFRPVQSWNPGKVEEHKERKHFNIKESEASASEQAKDS